MGSAIASLQFAMDVNRCSTTCRDSRLQLDDQYIACFVKDARTKSVGIMLVHDALQRGEQVFHLGVEGGVNAALDIIVDKKPLFTREPAEETPHEHVVSTA